MNEIGIEIASNENYDYLENEQGEKIYAHKVAVSDKILSVYQIPKVNDEKITYRFRDEGNLLNDGWKSIYLTV